MKHTLPPTQHTTRMQLLANVFKEAEPDTYACIMGMEGNPRIFKVAYGYDDHVSFIVDAGYGDKVKNNIFIFCSNSKYTRVSVHWSQHADIVTWWA